MSAPCCPERALQRGWPFTPHWFAWHDADGAIDTWATWRAGGLPRSDLELALITGEMFAAHGRPLMHVAQPKHWHMWDGSGRYAPRPVTFSAELTRNVAVWARQALADVMAAVDEEVALAPDPRVARRQADEFWKPHKSYIRAIWNDAGQRAAGNQIAAVHGTDETVLDRMTGQIVVDNGVIDYQQVMRDGYVRLAPHDPRSLITKRMGAGVRWDPDARCEWFERFMRSSVLDDEQRDWLMWRTACALFGLSPRKGFLNLIGMRDSGKSTFTVAVSHLAGDYARNVPVETFLAQRQGEPAFRQHELMGERFVHTHEPNATALYDVSFMKTITGNDPQRTRTMYQGFVQWNPQCTLFIGSNNPIRFNTADDAMVSRLEAVLFERGYGDHPDEQLPAKLRGEADGILRLLIGYVQRASRLGTPDLPFSVVQLRERMVVETEDALSFVEEWKDEGRLHDDHDAAAVRCVQVGPLYQHYKYWCDEVGVKPLGRKQFSAILGRKYPRMRSGGAWHFLGLVEGASA